MHKLHHHNTSYMGVFGGFKYDNEENHLNFQCVLNNCNINGISTPPYHNHHITTTISQPPYHNHHDHLRTFCTNKWLKALLRTPRKPPPDPPAECGDMELVMLSVHWKNAKQKCCGFSKTAQSVETIWKELPKNTCCPQAALLQVKQHMSLLLPSIL